ncbi:hypothetical protein GOP47_0004527 [Adiantum capillus-veneris]|uniref:RING-type E3 ubiquitin transferase n=1 Tax=Adiantum capillus-veneris TaxID=13818 RepID=A0A9D4V7Q3_ADICA|nr:hypothetical protein GOP47_0004527 [Adiantum capillus-veneris]
MELPSHLTRRRRYYYGELLMPPLHPSGPSLVKSLITLALEILDAQKSHPSCLQKRNLAAISCRIRILLMFLEEARDIASVLPPSVLLCFSELHVVFQGIKLLSEDCMQSSRISVLMEHRKMSEFFHRLSLEMATALEILPFALLDVSSEVQEQVELVKKQAKRAKLYVDVQESRLYTEVRRAMGQIERKEAPNALKLSEIFSSLGLRNAEDCQREIEKLQAEEVEGLWDTSGPARRLEDRKVPLSDLISFVRYGKCVLYGASETAFELISEMLVGIDGLDESEIKIPDDFRCPISLELMRDPVTVATGQTYERAEITRWISDGNNHTCPKSGLPLAHTTLIPNFALRNLIRQWCLQNNVHMSIPRNSSRHTSYSASLSTPTTLEATKLTVEFLLRQLPSASPDTQRHIVGELRVLAKCSSDNRKVVADAGAIPSLVTLLSASDSRTQEHAVTAILNLSIYAPNKLRIVNDGGLDSLIKLLQSGGCEVVRENAAAALFSLSQATEAAAEMGRKAESIKGLLQIVKEGSARGRRDAASALFNMAVYEPNREVLVKAGVVAVIVARMTSLPERGGMEEEALALLAVLAGKGEGRDAIVATEATLPMLGEVLRVGMSVKGRENSAAILLSLCKYGGRDVITKVQRMNGVLASLHSLLNHGSPRARRKAASLLRMLLR